MIRTCKNITCKEVIEIIKSCDVAAFGVDHLVAHKDGLTFRINNVPAKEMEIFSKISQNVGLSTERITVRREIRKWTDADDRLVMSGLPFKELARILGKSYNSVINRKHKLRKMGVLNNA